MSHPDPPAEQPTARGSAPMPPAVPGPPPMPPTGPSGYPAVTAPMAGPPVGSAAAAGGWGALPIPAGRPPRGGAGKTAALVVLSVVAALLFAGWGVMGYLWWTTHTELRGQVDDLTGAVGARDAEVDRLSEDLRQTRDRLAGTEDMVQLLEEQQDVIRECIVLASQVNDMIESGGTPSQEELDEVRAACDEADEILGF